MPEDEEVVIIRDVLPEDLPILFEYQRQPAANAMAAFPARDWDTFVAHWAKISKDENAITRAVVLQGEVAGNIGSWEQDGRREIGYWIGMEHWGKGVATKAVSAFLRQVETAPSLRARGEAQRGLTPRLAEVRVHDRRGGAARVRRGRRRCRGARDEAGVM